MNDIQTDRTPDRITKTTVLRAPRARVWGAITDAEKFGAWFGVRFDGPFRAGAALTGVCVPTQVDPEIAAAQAQFEGSTFDISVARVEPEAHFSFRWHPFALDEDHDYSQEPTTLVAFDLEETDEGTRLTITESGFSQVPLERRAKAFEMNQGGWEAQARLLSQYLEQRDG